MIIKSRVACNRSNNQSRIVSRSFRDSFQKNLLDLILTKLFIKSSTQNFDVLCKLNSKVFSQIWLIDSNIACKSWRQIATWNSTFLWLIKYRTKSLLIIYENNRHQFNSTIELNVKFIKNWSHCSRINFFMLTINACYVRDTLKQ